MFCKWCGADLSPSDIQCSRCGREVPPKSDCGGFFDLPISQTVSIPVESPVVKPTIHPDPVPAPKNSNMRKNFSKLTSIMCGCFVTVFALLAVMLVRSWKLPGQVAQLEKQVKALSAGKEDAGLKEEDLEFGLTIYADRVEEDGLAQIFSDEPAPQSYTFRFTGAEEDAFIFKAAAEKDKICVTLQYKESVLGEADGDPECALSYQNADGDWTDLSAPEVTVDEESGIVISFPTEEIETLLEAAEEQSIRIRLTCKQENTDGGSFTFTAITTPEE